MATQDRQDTADDEKWSKMKRRPFKTNDALWEKLLHHAKVLRLSCAQYIRKACRTQIAADAATVEKLVAVEKTVVGG